MQTGLERIAFQRNDKQIKKHGFTGEHHANHPEWYDKGQLIDASVKLSRKEAFTVEPKNWDSNWWIDLCLKPYIERLAISASFLAAEIDRLTYIEFKQNLTKH